MMLGSALRAHSVASRSSEPPSCSVDSTWTDAARRRVATYSGGMRRRLDLALSFVVDPDGAVPRRAHHRARHAQSTRTVERDPRAGGCRHHGAADHAVPRGGRSAGRSHRRDRRRAHRRRAAPPTSSSPASAAKPSNCAIARASCCAMSRPTARSRACGGHSTCSTNRARRARSTLRRPSLDDVFLSLTAGSPTLTDPAGAAMTTTVNPTAPALGPTPGAGIRPRITGLDRRVRLRQAQPAALAARRRVAPDGDHAAGHADAAVHLRLRRGARSERRVRRLCRARHHPAVRGLRCGLHRRLRRARPADRHHRPLPHDAAAQRRSADRPCDLEPDPQSGSRPVS